MSPARDGEYLPTDGLRGHALRNVNLMNRSLQVARETARTLNSKRGSADTRGVRIALLIAETRVLVLRMTVDAFAKAARMHKHAVQNAETPNTHPQHESMSRIYRTWCKRDVPSKTQQQLLDLLIPQRDARGRRWRDTVEGLYRKWVYQAGQSAFEKASRKANGNRPLKYGTLWQRHVSGVVPDFEEVRIIGGQLGRDLHEAGEIWSQQKSSQLTARGVNELLVRLIVLLQLKHKGLWMHEKSLAKRLGIKSSTAEALASCRMPPPEEIKGLVRSVIPAARQKSFLSQWERAQSNLSQAETFATAFQRIRDANGWTNQLISSLLQIKPPEKRNRGAARPAKTSRRRTRREAYRPSAELRRMYRETVFSSQAPAKSVIELVARDDVKEGPRGETQRQYLTSLFLKSVAEKLRLQGSALEHSRLRLHRVLCGTSAEQLASVSEYTRDEILLIEQGRIKITARVERQLINAGEQFPLRKVERARRELDRLNSAPDTVPDAVTLLVAKLGGYVPLSRFLKDEQYALPPFSPATLKQIQAGTKVPSLPQLKRMLTLNGLRVSDMLLRDWYQRIPEYLIRHAKMHWIHPLARGVGVIVLEQATSMHDFWEQHCRDDFTYSVMTRNFKQMNGPSNIGWPTVSRYLNAAGLGLDDPRRLYLHGLFMVRERITENLTKSKVRKKNALIRDVLRQWRHDVSKSGNDPGKYDFKLGLTTAEHEMTKRG